MEADLVLKQELELEYSKHLWESKLWTCEHQLMWNETKNKND